MAFRPEQLIDEMSNAAEKWSECVRRKLKPKRKEMQRSNLVLTSFNANQFWAK